MYLDNWKGRKGGVHTRWAERERGSIVRKTPDTALYSINVSTLWMALFQFRLYLFISLSFVKGHRARFSIECLESGHKHCTEASIRIVDGIYNISTLFLSSRS